MAKRNDVLRWAAPAAFLAAVTVAVLLVRAGLHHGAPASSQATVPAVVTPVAKTKKATAPKKRPAAATAANTYTIQSGDTYGSIATKFNTTVAALEALNPGVDSNALSVGQKIRVK
jgi:LysM repeat protein